jgi:hypothetical protein
MPSDSLPHIMSCAIRLVYLIIECTFFCMLIALVEYTYDLVGLSTWAIFQNIIIGAHIACNGYYMISSDDSLVVPLERGLFVADLVLFIVGTVIVSAGIKNELQSGMLDAARIYLIFTFFFGIFYVLCYILYHLVKIIKRHRSVMIYHLETTPINHEHQMECGICVQPYQELDEILELPCSHRYHHKCLQHWLMIKYICPMCRAEV